MSEQRPIVWVTQAGTPGDQNPRVAAAREIAGPNGQVVVVNTNRPPEEYGALPDVIIGGEAFDEMYVREIKSRSGGRTRAICMQMADTQDHLTSPREVSLLEPYDLIFGYEYFPQEVAPDLRSRYKALPTVPSPITTGTMAQARHDWHGKMGPFNEQRHPVIAVLLGGPVENRNNMSVEDARNFGAQINNVAAERGGSVLLTSSIRTTSDIYRAFGENITTPSHYLHWYNHSSSNAPNAEASNPYRAMLANADVVVVTGDSMSMISDAIATGKPVYIIQPPGGLPPIQQAFVNHILREGLARPYSEGLPGWQQAPVRAVPNSATQVARETQAMLGTGGQQPHYDRRTPPPATGPASTGSPELDWLISGSQRRYDEARAHLQEMLQRLRLPGGVPQFLNVEDSPRVLQAALREAGMRLEGIAERDGSIDPTLFQNYIHWANEMVEAQQSWQHEIRPQDIDRQQARWAEQERVIDVRTNSSHAPTARITNFLVTGVNNTANVAGLATALNQMTEGLGLGSNATSIPLTLQGAENAGYAGSWAWLSTPSGQRFMQQLVQQQGVAGAQTFLGKLAFAGPFVGGALHMDQLSQMRNYPGMLGYGAALASQGACGALILGGLAAAPETGAVSAIAAIGTALVAPEMCYELTRTVLGAVNDDALDDIPRSTYGWAIGTAAGSSRTPAPSPRQPSVRTTPDGRFIFGTPGGLLNDQVFHEAFPRDPFSAVRAHRERHEQQLRQLHDDLYGMYGTGSWVFGQWESTAQTRLAEMLNDSRTLVIEEAQAMQGYKTQAEQRLGIRTEQHGTHTTIALGNRVAYVQIEPLSPPGAGNVMVTLSNGRTREVGKTLITYRDASGNVLYTDFISFSQMPYNQVEQSIRRGDINFHGDNSNLHIIGRDGHDIIRPGDRIAQNPDVRTQVAEANITPGIVAASYAPPAPPAAVATAAQQVQTIRYT